MKKLIDLLKEEINNIEAFSNFCNVSESEVLNKILKLLYDYNNGNLIPMILFIDKLQKEEQENKNRILYGGLEDAMHNFSSLSNKLENNKIKDAKESFNFYLNGDNIAMVIRIAMGYFPKGNLNGASENDKWFFNKFKNMLMLNKEKYLNGDSTDWAKQHGYYEYIKLVIDQN